MSSGPVIGHSDLAGKSSGERGLLRPVWSSWKGRGRGGGGGGGCKKQRKKLFSRQRCCSSVDGQTDKSGGGGGGGGYTVATGYFKLKMQKWTLENQNRAPENFNRLECKSVFNGVDLGSGTMWKVIPKIQNISPLPLLLITFCSTTNI